MGIELMPKKNRLWLSDHLAEALRSQEMSQYIRKGSGTSRGTVSEMLSFYPQGDWLEYRQGHQ